MLGYTADVSAGASVNRTALGYGAIATADNSVQIGNASVTVLKCADLVIDSTNGAKIGSPTGGQKGTGTINTAGLYVNGVAVSTGTASTPTFQYLLSGSSATYTTPANCRAIHVEFIGGGGGGSGSGSTPGAGGNGGDTIFNSIHAKGGSGAAAATGSTSPVGAGGTGGTGSAALRIAGGDGGGGNSASSTNPNGPGGAGGMGVFGGGGLGMFAAAGKAGKANTGGGGGGGGTGANGSTDGGGGGGAGEYVILDITSPAATYTYTIGAGGSAGTVGGGSNPFAGAAGGTGFIRVTEYY
jgi:hypothetical protein